MKADLELTNETESFVIDQGADLVGVAPVERFQNAPEGYRPCDYMPDATCVVSIGIHINDGVCDVWGEYIEPGRSVTPYLFYGYGLLNLELGRIANRVAKRLEYAGYKSLTFPPTWAISMYRSMGLLNPDYMGADFSHRHAAVAAGLAEFGWNGLALTPVFGARVRFNSVITNAPLASSAMYEGPAICQPERCKYLCVRDCPAEALSTTDKKVAVIGDRRFEYTTIDMYRCMYGIFALVKGSGAIGGIEIPPGPGDIGHFWETQAQQDVRDRHMVENCFGIVCGDFCGRCLHKCPAHLYWRKGAVAGKKRAKG